VHLVSELINISSVDGQYFWLGTPDLNRFYDQFLPKEVIRKVDLPRKGLFVPELVVFLLLNQRNLTQHIFIVDWKLALVEGLRSHRVRFDLGLWSWLLHDINGLLHFLYLLDLLLSCLLFVVLQEKRIDFSKFVEELPIFSFERCDVKIQLFNQLSLLHFCLVPFLHRLIDVDDELSHLKLDLFFLWLAYFGSFDPEVVLAFLKELHLFHQNNILLFDMVQLQFLLFLMVLYFVQLVMQSTQILSLLLLFFFVKLPSPSWDFLLKHDLLMLYRFDFRLRILYFCLVLDTSVLVEQGNRVSEPVLRLLDLLLDLSNGCAGLV
jgi:hypothetical protein